MFTISYMRNGLSDIATIIVVAQSNCYWEDSFNLTINEVQLPYVCQLFSNISYYVCLFSMTE